MFENDYFINVWLKRFFMEPKMVPKWQNVQNGVRDSVIEFEKWNNYN